MEKCENQIVLFESSDKVVTLDVTIDKETVWLTQLQMAILFDVERSVISKHISNVFKEKEADEKSNVHFLHIANSDKPVKQYSLDIIISVGYRVKSKRGIEFRKWANSVLKEFLLKGYSVNQRFERLEQRVSQTEEKIEFFVRTALPPVEGVFFEGQIYDAYELACKLVKSAIRRIILIDNYIDESVLTLLDKRGSGVTAEIYTHTPNAQLQLDIQRHNSQYTPIPIHVFAHSHDRFLCIDDTVYHIGASLKDLGKKWFAFSRMEINTESLLGKM
ncbi:virulence RhuM family protein [bacterium]|nr:virulence RhuM family protein [bacterium]